MRRVVSQKLTDVSEVLTASIIGEMIALIMKAVSSSETSVNFNQTTRRNIPEEVTFILANKETWSSSRSGRLSP
jgi:hypothetical protein